MNKFMNINRVEFSITQRCTGRCKHCSVATKHNNEKVYEVDEQVLFDALEELCRLYSIESMMTFGGEPLLRAELTCALLRLGKQLHIKERHLITNGFFSRDLKRINQVAKLVADSGVTGVCISVDAFHQAFIDLKYVISFVRALKQEGCTEISFHPAWVVNKEDNNSYNQETHAILASLSFLNIPVDEGNNISLIGNAALYLKDFYPKQSLENKQKCGEIPYTNALDHIRFLTIEANGNVQICKSFSLGNLEQQSIGSMIDTYDPYNNRHMKAILEHGVESLDDPLYQELSPFETLCTSCLRRTHANRQMQP